jgi:hypothetical protein
MVDDNWLDNPGGAVVMDTAAVSSTVISTLKLLYGQRDEQGTLVMPNNWAIDNPDTFANFFTPEAAYVPRRLNYEEAAEVIEVEEADEE